MFKFTRKNNVNDFKELLSFIFNDDIFYQIEDANIRYMFLKKIYAKRYSKKEQENLLKITFKKEIKVNKIRNIIELINYFKKLCAEYEVELCLEDYKKLLTNQKIPLASSLFLYFNKIIPHYLSPFILKAKNKNIDFDKNLIKTFYNNYKYYQNGNFDDDFNEIFVQDLFNYKKKDYLFDLKKENKVLSNNLDMLRIVVINNLITECSPSSVNKYIFKILSEGKGCDVIAFDYFFYHLFKDEEMKDFISSNYKKGLLLIKEYFKKIKEYEIKYNREKKFLGRKETKYFVFSNNLRRFSFQEENNESEKVKIILNEIKENKIKNKIIALPWNVYKVEEGILLENLNFLIKNNLTLCFLDTFNQNFNNNKNIKNKGLIENFKNINLNYLDDLLVFDFNKEIKLVSKNFHLTNMDIDNLELVYTNRGASLKTYLKNYKWI